MRPKNPAESPAGSDRRKWLRRERRYSGAMWHAYWHEMKDPRFRGMRVIAYLDDASRCITGFGMFENVTPENAVLALRRAIENFERPASMLAESGGCLVPKRRETESDTTLFEDELARLGISLINSRPRHPETSAKIKRFFRTLEEHVGRFENLRGFMDWYNEIKPHWSLYLDTLETPLEAYSSKRATEAVRESDPEWMEADLAGQAT